MNSKTILVAGNIGNMSCSSALNKIQSGEKVSVSSDKGTLGNECNRSVCENKPALYFNKSTKKHYCKQCSSMINDATRGDAYRLYGSELCQLDESLTEEEIRMYEKLLDIAIPQIPESDLMDDAALDYKDTYMKFKESDIFSKGSMEDYLYGKLTRKEMEYVGKAIPVTSSITIGRNDPCPCKSGKKFKQCCINKR
ncbi:gp60 [Sphingomonas phage PAU]|uniref:gp60 n=1 Tax=Sphingomonas phage PAU TaxID=1150991 RepID=UPI00025731C6|nr:gp60 [Sphingomonas phage PAU]AFF28058.1 gp60 [Sphingomonas phage PAU]